MILDNILNVLRNTNSGSKDTDAQAMEKARKLSLRLIDISSGHSCKVFYTAIATILSFFMHQYIKKGMRGTFLDSLKKEILKGFDEVDEVMDKIDKKEKPGDD